MMGMQNILTNRSQYNLGNNKNQCWVRLIPIITWKFWNVYKLTQVFSSAVPRDTSMQRSIFNGIHIYMFVEVVMIQR